MGFMLLMILKGYEIVMLRWLFAWLPAWRAMRMRSRARTG